MGGCQGEQFEAGIEWQDTLRDDANAGSGFSVLQDGADEAGGVGDTGSETGLFAGGEDRVVRSSAFAAGKENDGLAGEFFPGERGFRSEGMMDGNDGTEGFLTEGEGFEIEGFVGDDRAGESHGETTAGDHFPDPFRSAFFENDSDPREALPVFQKQRSEEGASRGADVAEAEFTVFTGGGPADSAQRFFQTVEKEAGLLEQSRTCGGKANAAPIPVHEAAGEFEFEFLNGATQCGLGDAQSACGF